MNRLVEETLRHYVLENQSNWVQLLPMCEFAINNAFSSAIHTSPFYLNLGQYPRVPAALEHDAAPEDARSYVTKVAETIKLAQEAMKKAHDRMRARYTTTPISYAPSQSVLLSTKHLATLPALSSKLLPKWAGPFAVHRVINKGGHTVAVELILPPDWKVHPVFSTSLVKAFVDRDVAMEDLPPAPPELVPASVPEPAAPVHRLVQRIARR